MREVETDSSVIWPSWCYNTGENRLETDSLKSRSLTKSPVIRIKKSRRSTTSSSNEKRTNGINASIGSENRCPTPSAFTSTASTVTAVTSASNTTTTAISSIKMEVKTERLSPSSAITDNNSSGSGSNTPSSSYPGTPPNSNNHNDRVPSPSLSPAAQMSHSKIIDQPMARNYSDIMRSLAAKYNNSNPNDYYSTSKNGFTGTFGDPRFSSFKTNSTSPFVNLVPTLNSDSNSPPNVLNSSCHLTPSNTKDNDIDLKQILNATDAQNSLFSSFGLNTFNSSSVPSVGNLPLFSPLVDMSSTQALLNMVRTAGAGGVSQLESYMKSSGIKRPPDIALNPLDLSSNSQPCNSKKLKRPPSSTDNFNTTDNSMTSSNQKPIKERLQTKRTGSVSPKPRVKSSFLFSLPQNAATAATVAQIPIADHRTASCLSLCTSSFDKTCPSRDGQESISRWTIDDVHNFVSSIDVCAEYADNFRKQSIDGISLPLLTEEHLRTTINMKLGPALKFRAILAQKIGHCNVCMHCLHCHGTTGHSLTPLLNSSPTFHSANRPNSAGN